ncbi:hypothetical protein BCL57_002133 [Agromyces flavus]|uniref:Uncharacterized protein n=1 Tax=Agromyces flavus TaxID=589382 RepID=A0A1H1P837_9MICO|nr:hypothetical protein [Agromyces flavus]MCP2367974.1 hypothetical protein [Agromyces flavus]GGI47436.1 hypothetical protein GCM10010932_21240 [Agromyces flavus]SDS07362.1 hypothetical protein SAMN04489721_0728 [Agromyces flavus]
MTRPELDLHRRTDGEWPDAVKTAVLVLAGLSVVLWVTGIWFTVPVSLAALALAEMAAPELGRARIWLLLLGIAGVVLGVGRILATI